MLFRSVVKVSSTFSMRSLIRCKRLFSYSDSNYRTMMSNMKLSEITGNTVDNNQLYTMQDCNISYFTVNKVVPTVRRNLFYYDNDGNTRDMDHELTMIPDNKHIVPVKIMKDTPWDAKIWNAGRYGQHKLLSNTGSRNEVNDKKIAVDDEQVVYHIKKEWNYEIAVYENAFYSSYERYLDDAWNNPIFEYISCFIMNNVFRNNPYGVITPEAHPILFDRKYTICSADGNNSEDEKKKISVALEDVRGNLSDIEEVRDIISPDEYNDGYSIKPELFYLMFLDSMLFNHDRKFSLRKLHNYVMWKDQANNEKVAGIDYAGDMMAFMYLHQRVTMYSARIGIFTDHGYLFHSFLHDKNVNKELYYKALHDALSVNVESIVKDSILALQGFMESVMPSLQQAEDVMEIIYQTICYRYRYGKEFVLMDKEEHIQKMLEKEQKVKQIEISKNIWKEEYEQWFQAQRELLINDDHNGTIKITKERDDQDEISLSTQESVKYYVSRKMITLIALHDLNGGIDQSFRNTLKQDIIRKKEEMRDRNPLNSESFVPQCFEQSLLFQQDEINQEQER